MHENFKVYHGYRVYQCGCIYSKRNDNKKMYYYLRPRIGGGYDAVVKLRVKGEYEKWTVSRLVLFLYGDKKCKKEIRSLQVNHIDRNYFNNHFTNLEWVTPSENQKYWRKSAKGINI